MAAPDVVKASAQILEELKIENVESLLTNPDWGKVNFLGARKDVELVVAIAAQLRNLPIELLPESEMSQLMNPLRELGTHFKQIRNFNIEQGNATGVRDGIVSHIRGQTDQAYIQAQMRLPFLAYQRGDVRRNEEALGTLVGQVRRQVLDVTKLAEDKAQEINAIITAAREASATVGVAHFTKDFSDAANDLDVAASNWLIATVVVAGLTIAAALLFPIVFPVTGALDVRSVQVFTSKLVVLGSLFTATIWCGRIYKAKKHQVAVNRHRSNALKTFQAFIKAASDDQTRNAVLIETTRCIFAGASTGYLDGSESSGDGAVQILEVVKSAAGAAKPG